MATSRTCSTCRRDRRRPRRGRGSTRLACLLLIAFADAAVAGRFVCEPVDERTPGHSRAVHVLQAALPSAPAEIRYCRGPSPRWVARWNPFESRDGWRLFATAVCFDRDDPVQCRVERHAAVAGSHQVIDLPYPIALDRVIELFAAATRDHPDAEVTEISYEEVTDGGVWSAEAYGYRVRLMEAPDYEGGNIPVYRRACPDPCRWFTDPDERTAFWMGGSGDVALRARRRDAGDPMIDFLYYLGR